MSLGSITPIFIFSLPRSGSTLLQKIIANHEKVATTSEPWILLPLLSPLRQSGSTFSDYGFEASSNALKEYCGNLKLGLGAYRQVVHEVAIKLYHGAAHPEASFFIDKTPRYHLIVQEIIKCFPEAKYVFLWRHPIATVSSLMSTFNDDKWNLYRYKVDLFNGLHNLVDAYESNKSTSFSLNYEELVNPELNNIVLDKLFDYLGLVYDSEIKSSFQNVTLSGSFGDPNIKLKKSISSDSVSKWKSNMNSVIRKRWAINYVNWIGEERLKTMGYDMNTILTDLKDISPTSAHLLSDVRGYLEYALRPWIEPSLWKAKLRENNRKFNVQHY
ncbi:Sulfotransferase family protein [Catalinimonas alkaloidigena]|uniref:Sulfotransferase family protein n=1 Tax=Catalinimonas alkaloidigena TaxID=1075417 RepID=A0A1G9J4D5_9BACT|nr:sulfotransferase [Catalinimonas alkaloidigena]SDL32024.1 Sulfotransferase family protein [Catalinimonas alkaloidigena]